MSATQIKVTYTSTSRFMCGAEGRILPWLRRRLIIDNRLLSLAIPRSGSATLNMTRR